MSDFTYLEGINYFTGFSPFPFGAGTVIDSENDDVFDLNDPDGGGYTYAGTVVVEGITMPAFIGANTVQIYNPGPTAVTTWPASSPTITAGNFPFCFSVGTQIATLDGEVPVEEVQIGDKVRIAAGGLAAVRWIGRQTIFPVFAGPGTAPVRIRAGALGGGLPHSDLTVTADHGMVIDGLVINASALVNGHSINFVPMAELEDSYTVYHVETEAHDVILANGAPSETFIDYRDRRAFDNYQEYLDLYGCERIIPEMPAPRISSQRLLSDAIKVKLHILQTPVDDLLSTCA